MQKNKFPWVVDFSGGDRKLNKKGFLGGHGIVCWVLVCGVWMKGSGFLAVGFPTLVFEDFWGCSCLSGYGGSLESHTYHSCGDKVFIIDANFPAQLAK